MGQNDLNIGEMIDVLVNNAKTALEEFEKFSQEEVDKIAKAMAISAMEHRLSLAKSAVEETGRGIVEDKVIKNMFASEYIWNSIEREKTVGKISENSQEGFFEIADPVGVIAGVTPVTNPTSTTIFKSIICAKTRNPIIFGFHPGAQKCSVETAKILRESAIKAGAPKHFIQWIEYPSVEATSMLMNHSGVDVVLATGGSAMVKSAYSTGKPALGVGPGNVPCYIEKTANLKRACHDIILSKTFDNGMICASEQSVIVDKQISNDFEKIMSKNDCYFLSDEEISKLEKYMITEKGTLNGIVAGKSAFYIAKNAGINVQKNTKILIAKLCGVGREFPLSAEKLSPVLSYYIVKNSSEGFGVCKKVLNFNGAGHTAVIHSENSELIEKFGIEMDACRIIVNSPSSHGAIGGIYNSNTPSLTLGCGSKGKNSVSSNISVKNLINIKKVFERRNNMQWFRIPSEIYFEKNSIACLETMENVDKVFIITDKTMVDIGNIEKIIYCLNNRLRKCKIEIFSNVLPDPNTEIVFEGLKLVKNFAPDTIIAIGGGSVIDAAKAIWAFYENENLNFDDLRLNFMDIRKRICKYPVNHTIKLIAIPTTSGTGSEVTSFSVITDKNKNVKYPLADYYLTPTVSIIDPQFTVNLPKIPTADTGMDVLTHAIEAYVSTMASDFTDALAISAFKLVFKYIRRAYKNGKNDFESREKMHNASCMAGMAFTNAFLGLNHSMAHKLGAKFHISHGRANAIILPYVIKYNSSISEKFVSFPKYSEFVADKKYIELAKSIGIFGNSDKDILNKFINEIFNLNKDLDIPCCLKDCGISENEFLEKVSYVSELAYKDQCTGTNPKSPMISEIRQLYLNCYYGEL